MAFTDQSNRGALSEINVTPLVDVMLVLLVIFMVTAPILQQGVTVQLPSTNAGAMPGDEQGLIISLTQGGKLYLNDVNLSQVELALRLEAILKERPDKQVFLRADTAVPYGDVVSLMARLKESGVQRLGMVTEPPAQEQ